ncbi:hypothetical protein HCN44_001118 [Aphidius gifuensis]|uniref:Uncharacterized protein n=1 Tax=Aphidius gifuensis TaxID=684658 RepID=A0A834XKF1_APHGI|nr:hypothetical protein HCN44_001118 [Aphidius gifuensis]
MKQPPQLIKFKGVNESFNYSGSNLHGIFDKTPIVVLEKNTTYYLKNDCSISNNNSSIENKLIKKKPLNKISSKIKKNKLNKKISTLSINNELLNINSSNYLIQLQQNNEIEISNLSKNFNLSISKIINNPNSTIVQNDVDDKIIKMLVNMKNGKQKLIQFELIGNCTTISDLLKYTEIPYTNKTKIYFVNDKLLNINYVVDTYEDNIEYIENTLYNNNYETINCPNCGKSIDKINECNKCHEKYSYDVRLIPKNSTISQKKIIMSVADNFYNNNSIDKDNNIKIKSENLNDDVKIKPVDLNDDIKSKSVNDDKIKLKKFRKIRKYHFSKDKTIDQTNKIDNNENDKKNHVNNDVNNDKIVNDVKNIINDEKKHVNNNDNNGKIVNDVKSIINDEKNNINNDSNDTLTEKKIGANLANRLRRIRKKKIISDY